MSDSEQLQVEELSYQGSMMSAKPLNVSLTELARRLHQGEPAVVILEPGDATRYRLLITSCWAQGIRNELADVGIPARATNEYLLVTKFDGHLGDAWFASATVEDFDVPVSNKWSCALLAWWLRLLWLELESAELEKP